MRIILGRLPVLAICLLCVATVSAGSLKWPGQVHMEPVVVTQSHMGMAVTLTVWADDAEAARKACRVAFARVSELNGILSDYEPESELSRLCRAAGEGPQEVSDELFTVLAAAKELSEQSGGLYDPTAAPVIRLWREARQTKRLPDPALIENALKLVGADKLLLDPDAKTVELTQIGMQLDLGAIAKGYVGDEAIRVLREQGFPIAAFEAGGDMVVGDSPPGEKGWTIEPQGFEKVTLTNAAIAISGNSEQFVEIDGKRYGHIIDPRTGWPVEAGRACVVIAPTGLIADPLATLGTMMEPEEFGQLVAAHYPAAKVVRVAQSQTCFEELDP